MRRVDPAPVAAAGRRRGDFAVRLASALVLIPVALGGAWLGGWPAYALAAIVAAIVYAEWAYVVRVSPVVLPGSPIVWAGTLGTAIAALAAGGLGPLAGLSVALAVALVAGTSSRSSWLVLGGIYAGLFGVALAAIRSDAVMGLDAIVVLLVVVWGSDSFAYFFGRSLGGPKLWPRVSPKKTWSGAIGGLVGGVAAAFLVSRLLSIPPSAGLVLLLVLLSLASQAGDLAESALKRRFDRKDSSAIIPGHGGAMDRVDGLIFAAVLALFVGWAHQGAEAIGRGILVW